MLEKNEILSRLKELKPKYEQEGVIILGIFGSYAKERQNKFSDIDIAYALDYEKFTQKYLGGFSKVLRLDAIKKELESTFHTQIDFVSNSNKAILKDIVYV